MLWFRRQPEADNPQALLAAARQAGFDERVFQEKFAGLLAALGTAGGVDPFLHALGIKSRLFQSLLDPGAAESLTHAKAELLLEVVMPARKRLWPALSSMEERQLGRTVVDLIYGDAPVDARLGAFVAAVPEDHAADAKLNKKLKRAAHDFAAELLHFRAPANYPLMTRWVWDPATRTGALREFLKNSDTTSQVHISDGVAAYEIGRAWLAEQLAAQGVYREPHFVIDLVLAQAYADYVQAMSSGMGFMQPHFGGKSDPLEVVKKLLGIDDARRTGSRLKRH